MQKKIAENITRFSIISIILGLYFSNALKSIGIVCLAATILFHPDTLKSYRVLIKNKLFVSVLIIAACYLLSVCYGGNLYYYWISSKNKLLYFFVPVAIYNLRLGENEIKSLKYLFVGCAVVQSVYALFFLFNHPGALQLYSLGRVLPTIEINHVEISWLISIGVLLLLDNYKNISVVPEKLIVGLIVIWLFFFLHLFAVRTGLLCVYLFLSIFFIVEIEKNKKLRKYFILLPTVVALSFFLSYKLSDSIRYKLDYTRYDINRFQGGASDFQLYSDGRRLQSIKIGLMLIREYPWLGCGIGNIKDKCDEIYKTNYPGISPENYYRPHSLYVYITCCFGFIIGGFLIFCFIYPLIYFLQKKNYLFFNLYSSFIIVSVWDVVMGTLFGECLYLLVIGWGLKMDVHENITPQQQ